MECSFFVQFVWSFSSKNLLLMDVIVDSLFVDNFVVGNFVDSSYVAGSFHVEMVVGVTGGLWF